MKNIVGRNIQNIFLVAKTIMNLISVDATSVEYSIDRVLL